jgi:hypothetical protein
MLTTALAGARCASFGVVKADGAWTSVAASSCTAAAACFPLRAVLPPLRLFSGACPAPEVAATVFLALPRLRPSSTAALASGMLSSFRPALLEGPASSLGWFGM